MKMKRRTFVKTLPAATVLAGTASGTYLRAAGEKNPAEHQPQTASIPGSFQPSLGGFWS